MQQVLIQELKDLDKEEDAIRLRVRWTLHCLLLGKAILQATNVWG